jgi:peptide/nickel transport system substrate-binding protein
VVATTVAGCQGENQSEPTEDDQNTDQTQAGDGETGGNGGGGGEQEVVLVQNGVVRTIDPHKHTDLQTTTTTVNLYDPFVLVGDGRSPVAHLATEWETENGGETWVFTIRDDVTFHSGNQLTADDVAYSMERALAVGQGQSNLWGDFLETDGIEVRNETTVAFNLSSAFGPMLATLIQFIVVDSQTVSENEADGDFGEHGDFGQAYLSENVAGSGAYTLGEWQQESQLVFEQYEDYWGGWSENQFERARLERVPEESTVKLMMQQGDADLTTSTLSVQTFNEIDSYDNAEVVTATRSDLFHIPFHTQKAPTDDLNVRKALAHSIDYETIIEDILGGGTPAAGPVPDTMPGKSGSVVPYEQDLDQAKAYLDQASYSVDEINDIGLEHVYIASVGYMENLALVIQNSFGELGIELELNGQQWPTIAERATVKSETPHTQELFIFANYPSADTFTYQMYHPSAFESVNGASWYTTDELKALLEGARTTADREERIEKYEQAQQLIYDGYPAAFVVYPRLRIGKSASLGGYQYKGITGYDYRFHEMHRN